VSWTDPCTCNAQIPTPVQVKTTLAKLDSTWDKLNEYDINVKLRDKCLPPAVIKYGELGEAQGDGGEAGMFIAIFIAVFGCVAGVIVCVCCGASRKRQASAAAVPGISPHGASEFPVATAVAQGGQVEMAVPSDLPAGWSKRTDPATGRVYYQNELTQTTQWDPPVVQGIVAMPQ
jgi:hypothetical protein